jgi:hypothetical protein
MTGTERERKRRKFWEESVIKSQALGFYRIGETTKGDRLLEANGLWRCPICFTIVHKEPDKYYHVAFHEKGKRKRSDEELTSEHMYREAST